MKLRSIDCWLLRGGVGMLFVGLLAPLLVPFASAERLAYNDKKIPTVADLMEIEKSLKEALPKARAATVCIQLGAQSGSGVIVSKDGLVLTAAHVTTAVGKKVTVIMEDGTAHKAISLGLDSETDAAMLQILDKGSYPFVEVGKARAREEASTVLGDWVFSLGHSVGYDKDRGSVVRIGRLTGVRDTTLQSDCKIISGDSGGPLFDMHGVLVGIHSRVGRELNANMHVPIHVFNAKWDEMLKGTFIGEGPFARKSILSRILIGAELQLEDEGMRVKALAEGSPALKEGLQEGDLITAVEGVKAVEENKTLNLMKSKKVGDRITLTLSRGGKELSIEVELQIKRK